MECSRIKKNHNIRVPGNMGTKGGHGTVKPGGSPFYRTFPYGRYGTVMVNRPDGKVR
jgi:hypothetical protein